MLPRVVSPCNDANYSGPLSNHFLNVHILPNFSNSNLTRLSKALQFKHACAGNYVLGLHGTAFYALIY